VGDEKYELDESDTILLRGPYWADIITFFLPISMIGVISVEENI
jgi:hypothetical protein